MNNLEFELWSTSGIKKDIDSKAPEKQENDSASSIAHSVKVIKLLKEEASKHNKEASSNKTTTKELKQVYMDAAKSFDKGRSLNINEWSLSKVFLYLRMKGGEAVEGKYVNIEIDNEINISMEWTPSEGDLKKAKACIEKNRINYEFKNVDDLYLEDYKRILFKWE